MIICFNVWRTFLWIIMILFLFVFSAVVYWSIEDWIAEIGLKIDKRRIEKSNKKKNGVK